MSVEFLQLKFRIWFGFEQHLYIFLYSAFIIEIDDALERSAHASIRILLFHANYQYNFIIFFQYFELKIYNRLHKNIHGFYLETATSLLVVFIYIESICKGNTPVICLKSLCSLIRAREEELAKSSSVLM